MPFATSAAAVFGSLLAEVLDQHRHRLVVSGPVQRKGPVVAIPQPGVVYVVDQGDREAGRVGVRVAAHPAVQAGLVAALADALGQVADVPAPARVLHAPGLPLGIRQQVARVDVLHMLAVAGRAGLRRQPRPGAASGQVVGHAVLGALLMRLDPLGADVLSGHPGPLSAGRRVRVGAVLHQRQPGDVDLVHGPEPVTPASGARLSRARMSVVDVIIGSHVDGALGIAGEHPGAGPGRDALAHGLLVMLLGLAPVHELARPAGACLRGLLPVLPALP